MIQKLLSLPIRVKITFAIFFLIIALTLMLLFVIRHEFEIHGRTLSKESVQSLIESNKGRIIKLILEDDVWQIYKYLDSLTKLNFIESVGLMDKNNKVIAHTDTRYKIGSLYHTDKNDNTFVLPLVQSDMFFGRFVFQLDQEYAQPYYDAVKKKIYFLLVIAAMITMYLGYIIATRILKRLEILSRNAKHMLAQEWDRLEYINSYENDEITNLIHTLEEMMQTVGKMIQQEEKLKRFYHKIIDHIDELIIVYDKNFVIEYHNTNDLAPLVIQNEQFCDRFVAYLHEIHNNQAAHTFVYKWQNGTTRYLFVSQTQLDANRYALAISDISELKQMEKQRQISHSFKLVNDLSAMLIHEIKNLLQPLKLLLFHGKPEQMELQRAEKIVNKIDNIVFDILHPYKLEEHIIDEPISMQEIVDESLFYFASQLEIKKIRPVKSVNTTPLVYVHTKDIKLILNNLIANSIDASQANGEIFIGWEKISTQFGCLKVIDYGGGIPSEMQEEIKKPFFTTKEQGSGIGLFSVYKLTYLYNGYIELDSRAGKTEFRVYLPIQQKVE